MNTLRAQPRPLGFWKSILFFGFLLALYPPVLALLEPLLQWLPVETLVYEMILNMASNILVLGLALGIGLAAQRQTPGEVLPQRLPGGAGRRLLILLAVLLLAVGGSFVASEIDNLVFYLLPRVDFSGAYFSDIVNEPRCLPLSMFMLCVVAPITEEYVFRGFMLQNLLRRFRPWQAILFSSALFALFHQNPAQLPYTFCLGLLMAWSCYQTESLLPPLLIHAICNGLDVALYYGFGVLIPGWNAEGAFQPWWALVMGLMLLCGGASILLACHQPLPRRGLDVQEGNMEKPRFNLPGLLALVLGGGALAASVALLFLAKTPLQSAVCCGLCVGALVLALVALLLPRRAKGLPLWAVAAALLAGLTLLAGEWLR